MSRPPPTPWRTTARRLLLPGAMTAVMLAVLIGLGVWQLQRLAWKRDLLARLDAAEAAAPVPLPLHPQPLQKVRVTGRWLPGALAWYGSAVRDTRQGLIIGADLIVPLQLDNGPVILVDRGWMKLPRELPVTLPAEPVTVSGWLHPPERPGLFSANDSASDRRFYTLDPQVIGQRTGVAAILPFVLMETGGPTRPEGDPIPSAHMPRPPNDHFGYALTWFGLAAALAGVFMTYAVRLIRSPKGASTGADDQAAISPFSSLGPTRNG